MNACATTASARLAGRAYPPRFPTIAPRLPARLWAKPQFAGSDLVVAFATGFAYLMLFKRYIRRRRGLTPDMSESALKEALPTLPPFEALLVRSGGWAFVALFAVTATGLLWLRAAP